MRKLVLNQEQKHAQYKLDMEGQKIELEFKK